MEDAIDEDAELVRVGEGRSEGCGSMAKRPNRLEASSTWGVSGLEEYERRLVGLAASEVARKRRLVVPSAFDVLDRAEHTTATLCWSM
jgi:hypothetical protein